MQNGLPLGEGAPVRTLGRMRGTVPITLPLRSSRRGGTPGPPVKPSPSKGEGGTRSVTDEGAFLTCAIPGGSPKGLPYAKTKGLLETRRGGACPSRHSPEWSVARRRGGCHHPPVPKGFSHFVGRGLPDVPFHAWTGDREGRPYVDVRMYVKPGYRGRPGVPPLRESRNASAPAVPLSRT